MKTLLLELLQCSEADLAESLEMFICDLLLLMTSTAIISIAAMLKT